MISALIAVGKAILTKAAMDAASAKAVQAVTGDKKAPVTIGSGTAPSLQSGTELSFDPVQGSGVEEGITPFGYGEDTDSFEINNEEELMALLQQMSPEESGGIVSAATGKYLSRGTGGGITGSDLIAALSKKGIGSLDEIISSSLYAPQVPEITPPEVDMEAPQVPEKIGMFEDWYNSLDPETQKSLKGFRDKLILDTGSAVAKKIIGDEPKTRVAMTKTLPAGNAARRRIQFQPIGAKSGGVLDRKMFTPMLYGGELDGPGGPKEDLIPVMASDGEFMLSKAAVDQAGGGNHNKGIARLTAFNNKGNKRYG